MTGGKCHLMVVLYIDLVGIYDGWEVPSNGCAIYRFGRHL